MVIVIVSTNRYYRIVLRFKFIQVKCLKFEILWKQYNNGQPIIVAILTNYKNGDDIRHCVKDTAQEGSSL